MRAQQKCLCVTRYKRRPPAGIVIYYQAKLASMASPLRLTYVVLASVFVHGVSSVFIKACISRVLLSVWSARL